MFTYKKKINFYDCDPAGILFYGRIYELCHAGYEAMIESFDLNEDYWNNDYYVVPIIHSEASYHRPIKYGQEIIIEIIVTQLKSSSFELSYTCMNLNGEKHVKVKTAHVFVDKTTWKKKEMTGMVIAGLEKHLIS